MAEQQIVRSHMGRSETRLRANNSQVAGIGEWHPGKPRYTFAFSLPHRAYTPRCLVSTQNEFPCHGAKISLADEDDAPGRGPPEIAKIRPPATAAPSPWRAVGMRAWALQALPAGS